MALIDRCHLKHPFYGSRRVRGWLIDKGHHVNCKRVQRMMQTMGLTALYPGRNLSQGNRGPLLLNYWNNRGKQFTKIALSKVSQSAGGGTAQLAVGFGTSLPGG